MCRNFVLGETPEQRMAAAEYLAANLAKSPSFLSHYLGLCNDPRTKDDARDLFYQKTGIEKPQIQDPPGERVDVSKMIREAHQQMMKRYKQSLPPRTLH